jgi:membrane protease YdiL (CAAX protease family)
VDGWLALGLWAFYMASLGFQGWLLASGLGWVDAFPHGLAVVGPGVVVELCVLGLVVWRRRQGWRDLGFDGAGVGRSTLWGLGLGAALVLGAGVGPTLLQGASFYSPSFIADQAVWFLVWVALPEELIFRAFIMTRLQGLIGRASWAVAALLFGLSHFPFQFAISGLPLGAFLAQNYWMMLIPTGWGLAYGFLYAKFDSVVGPVIAHALADIASMGISPVAL